MIDINAEKSVPITISEKLWYPGKNAGFVGYPVSDRAQVIAKGRDELMGLLRNLPETEYELSLTDLVEKKMVIDHTDALHHGDKPPPKAENHKTSGMKMRSKSDGVLLNVFLPASFTRRSLTRSSSSLTGIGFVRDKRDSGRKRTASSCWPLLWEKTRGKSRAAAE